MSGSIHFWDPGLAVQNLAATGGMRSRRSIESVACLGEPKLEQYGSGHKILKTTLHEWLVIAEKDRKFSSARPFHQPSQTWAPTCQIRHWPPLMQCHLRDVSNFECQILAKKNHWHCLSIFISYPYQIRFH